MAFLHSNLPLAPQTLLTPLPLSTAGGGGKVPASTPRDNRHAGRFHGDLPVTKIHVSQHLGRFWNLHRSSIRIASVSLGSKMFTFDRVETLRSSLPMVGEVEKTGLVNAILSCTYLHTRNSDMNRKDGEMLCSCVVVESMSIARKTT